MERDKLFNIKSNLENKVKIWKSMKSHHTEKSKIEGMIMGLESALEVVNEEITDLDRLRCPDCGCPDLIEISHSRECTCCGEVFSE